MCKDKDQLQNFCKEQSMSISGKYVAKIVISRHAIVTARSFIVGFEPKFLCSVFNTSICLICISLLCCASFIIRSKETLQSCLKDAPFCRLLITFLWQCFISDTAVKSVRSVLFFNSSVKRFFILLV